jgi:hypothetical protein
MPTKENVRTVNSVGNPYHLSAAGIREVATKLVDQVIMTMACRNIPTPYDYELETDEATVELRQEIEKYIARMQVERLSYDAPDSVIVADDEDDDATEGLLGVSTYAITGEMPPLQSIPGWSSLSTEKQETLREHTKSLAARERLKLIHKGIHVFPAGKRH